MIPLNKPVIQYKRNERISLDTFVKNEFGEVLYSVPFSARQGLFEIYRELLLKHGKLNVAVSPLTCVEALIPIIKAGHNIIFIDINPLTFNMDEHQIPYGIDVIQAIHFGGNPQNMEVIKSKNPRFIVEDCAQAFGSRYKNIPVGLFGDFAVFSFMKNYYSLGGGLLLSAEPIEFLNLNSKKFNLISTSYRIIKRYIEKNNSFDSTFYNKLQLLLMSLKPDNTTDIIFNTSINNIIRKSIEKQLYINKQIQLRRIENAQFILSNIDNKDFIPQKSISEARPNYQRLLFYNRNEKTRNIILKLRKKGIGANNLSQSFVNNFQERLDDLPLFKKYVDLNILPIYSEVHDNIMSIPISPKLSLEEMKFIINTVNKL